MSCFQCFVHKFSNIEYFLDDIGIDSLKELLNSFSSSAENIKELFVNYRNYQITCTSILIYSQHNINILKYYKRFKNQTVIFFSEV